jgi:hypothetical protein
VTNTRIYTVTNVNIDEVSFDLPLEQMVITPHPTLIFRRPSKRFSPAFPLTQADIDASSLDNTSTTLPFDGHGSDNGVATSNEDPARC